MCGNILSSFVNVSILSELLPSRAYYSCSKLTSVLSGGGLIVIELMRRDAHSTLNNIICGSSTGEIDIFANSDLFIPTQNPTASAKLAHILFSIPSNPSKQKILEIKDCTCAVIKPHAVQNGRFTEINLACNYRWYIFVLAIY